MVLAQRVGSPELHITGRVLLVDPDLGTHTAVDGVLAEMGFELDLACDLEEGLTLLKASLVDCILLGIHGQEESDLRALDTIREAYPMLPIVTMTVDEGLDAVEEYAKHGAFHNLQKPVDKESLVSTLRFAIKSTRVNRESFRLMRSIEEARIAGTPLGHSRDFRRIMEQVDEMAGTNLPVLLIGEIGTGKKVLARAIHDASQEGPATLLNLHASSTTQKDIDSFLVENEHCVAGTLFLEDIEELSRPLQQHLSELLAKRLVAGETAKPCARLVCASSCFLEEKVEQGSFSEQLLDQLGASRILIPPLRERREDIPLMATWFLEQAQVDRPHMGFSMDAMMLLEILPWPENLRQLKSAVEHASGLAHGRPIERNDFIGPEGCIDVNTLVGMMVEESVLARKLAGIPPTEADVLPFEKEEKKILDNALQATSGNVTKAAKLLHIGRATMYRKIHQYDLCVLKQRRPRADEA